ncbi:S41 family peptidase [Asaia sp. BMEF1]|uniref:S41 family peptidase n=1 Tax=Asaia sp. BMEF1 TaxID=3155932 RepID=UPI003F67EC56
MISRRKALAGTITALASTSRRARAQGGSTRLFPENLRKDLDAIWLTLHEISPNPFQSSEAGTVENLYRQIRARITAPMSVRDAWMTIAPLLGALNDGHVALGFPGLMNKAPHYFPVTFTVDELSGNLIVERDRSGILPPGTHVLYIENISAAEYLDTTTRAFGGQTSALIRSRVSRAGAWTSVALFGVKAAYLLRWRDRAGIEHESLIPAPNTAQSLPHTAPYSFRWAANDVGLIEYRRCEDLSRFRAFLDETFTSLQFKAAKALIIDIRRNSGGDSELANWLWCYAQSRPFKQFGGEIVRSNAIIKADYGQDKYTRYYGPKAWSAPIGEVISFTEGPSDGLVLPKPLPCRFSGPVYLLISPATFSSGMACALAAKDYGLATIIGQETGEPATGSGLLYEFHTPNISFPVYLTTACFLAPKSHPSRQGVVPDIIVPSNTVYDLFANRDTALEKALTLIKN